MLPVLRSRAVLVALAVTATAAAAFGCSAILGLGDFDVGATDAGLTDTGTPDTGVDSGDGGNTCNVDLTTTCYPCAPTQTDQYLNSCTDGTCVPFDQTRLKDLLLPDGGLPPIPPDGG